MASDRRSGGLPMAIYIVLKKYCAISNKALLLAYRSKSTREIMDLIYSPEYKEKVFGKVSNLAGLKYKGLIQQFIDDTEINIKNGNEYYTKLYESPNNILGSSLVVNIHSVLGEEANKALTQLAKKAIDNGIKTEITSGIDLNNKFTSFEGEDRYDPESLIRGKQLLIIYATNSIHETEFKKQCLLDLLLICKLKSIPIFMSSNNKRDNTINIECNDTEKSVHALFDKLFNNKDTPKI
jgi:hypothetical protein